MPENSFTFKKKMSTCAFLFFTRPCGKRSAGKMQRRAHILGRGGGFGTEEGSDPESSKISPYTEVLKPFEQVPCKIHQCSKHSSD